MNINLTTQQNEQISAMGITPGKIEEQLNYFSRGFPYIKLAKPATLNDGIVQLNTAQTEGLINQYNILRKGKKILKFVPASGAASRMFKSLYEFIERNKNIENIDLNDQKLFLDFFNNIEKFAFYKDLDNALKAHNTSIGKAIEEKKYVLILETLLGNKGLNYGSLPKAMLKFHKYKDSERTAVEEHLVEAYLYANNDGQAYLHFTVSNEHRKDFETLVNNVKKEYEKKFKIKYDISYSEQKSSTDTIAVDAHNVPILDNGRLVFRPGGHGALLENLNDLDADVIFIKNIDNVVPDHLKDETVAYKQALAGMLLGYQKQIFKYLGQLHQEINLSSEEMNEMVVFAESINIHIPPQIKDLGKSVSIKYLKDKLNRPIRICGMVKNEGEPGGGPFWVDKEGELSIQIVESSQIDMTDRIQLDIFRRSTHFNPVDLVCCIKNYEERKFNLLDFRDNETGFITTKSKDGREIKQQELPGLWNGSMSDWITLFVEVPIATFNPVKTVHDLLRKQHQL